jgi:hypothetical protein
MIVLLHRDSDAVNSAFIGDTIVTGALLLSSRCCSCGVILFMSERHACVVHSVFSRAHRSQQGAVVCALVQCLLYRQQTHSELTDALCISLAAQTCCSTMLLSYISTGHKKNDGECTAALQ